MKRILTYGERSGAREFLALVPTEPGIQALLLGNGFKPMTPVYLFKIPVASAAEPKSGDGEPGTAEITPDLGASDAAASSEAGIEAAAPSADDEQSGEAPA